MSPLPHRKGSVKGILHTRETRRKRGKEKKEEKEERQGRQTRECKWLQWKEFVEPGEEHSLKHTKLWFHLVYLEESVEAPVGPPVQKYAILPKPGKQGEKRLEVGL